MSEMNQAINRKLLSNFGLCNIVDHAYQNLALAYKAMAANLTRSIAVKHLFQLNAVNRNNRNDRNRAFRLAGASPVPPLDSHRPIATARHLRWQWCGLAAAFFFLTSLFAHGQPVEGRASSCVLRANNTITCAALGTDNAMYSSTWNGATGDGWNHPGGGLLASEPTCVETDRLKCFALGTDQALYENDFTSGWGGWGSLGGKLTANPDCLSFGSSIDCFAKDGGNLETNRNLGGGFQGWTISGPGFLTSAPNCIGDSAEVDCFAVSIIANSNILHQARVNGVWQPWQTLGGSFVSPPSCVTAFGLIECFARATNNDIQHIPGDGFNWGSWESTGGLGLSAPSCVSTSSTKIDCFVVGTDRRLWHLSMDGAINSGWLAMGVETVISTPDCIVGPSSEIDCFVLRLDRALWHTGVNADGSQMLWQSMGGTIVTK